MVTGNAIGTYQSSKAICAGGSKFLDLARAGGRMVWAGSSTGDIVLKCKAVFPKVMEQPNHSTKTACSEFVRP
jgi:hypothetical protein